MTVNNLTLKEGSVCKNERKVKIKTKNTRSTFNFCKLATERHMIADSFNPGLRDV